MVYQTTSYEGSDMTNRINAQHQEKNLTPGDLLAEATRKMKELESKKKGLDFMAIKLSHRFKRRELRKAKEITPSEDYLLDEIEIGTIGAQNDRRDFCSKAEFWIDDLSNHLGYKSKAKIWRLLKSLETKGLIVREPTRAIGREKIGLNPAFWDQVLINTHHAIEQKRHLKLVPSERTNCMSTTNDLDVDNERIVGGARTIRSRSEHETSDRLLKTIQDSSKTEEIEKKECSTPIEIGTENMHPLFRRMMSGPRKS